ncbi:hypothetical protein BDZ91DRAFT_779807 [Kalaharituber pfeilii]|nr:hypothetical protein BDZ91DRAFT_779807 [Kalaharituber pfeilii]
MSFESVGMFGGYVASHLGRLGVAKKFLGESEETSVTHGRPQGILNLSDTFRAPRVDAAQCTTIMSRSESPALLTPSSSCFPSGISDVNTTRVPTPENVIPPSMSTSSQNGPVDAQVPVEDVYPEGDLILNLRCCHNPSSVTSHESAAPMVRFKVSSSTFRVIHGALYKLVSLDASEAVDLLPQLPDRLWGCRDDFANVSLLMPVLQDEHISAFRILMKLIHSQTQEFFLATSPFREPSAINLVTVTAEVAWSLGCAHVVCPWVQSWLAHCQRNAPMVKFEEYIQVHEACDKACTSFQLLRLAIAAGDKLACKHAVVAVLEYHSYSQLVSRSDQELFAIPLIIGNILELRLILDKWMVHLLQDLHQQLCSPLPHVLQLPNSSLMRDTQYQLLGTYVLTLSTEFNMRNLEFPEDDSIQKLRQFSFDRISKKFEELIDLLGDKWSWRMAGVDDNQPLGGLARFVFETFSDRRLESCLRITQEVSSTQLINLSTENFPQPSQACKTPRAIEEETIVMPQPDGSSQRSVEHLSNWRAQV